MAEKFLKHSNGAFAEQEALVTSAGAGDAGKIPALDNTGRLDDSVMPVGIGADTASVVASEALAAGDYVNIYNDLGTAKCRKADAATAGKEGMGYVLEAVNQNDSATVYFEGSNTQVTGVTPGPQYLSASSPGGFTSTPPSASGNVVQRIGVGVSTTCINVEFSQPIVLA